MDSARHSKFIGSSSLCRTAVVARAWCSQLVVGSDGREGSGGRWWGLGDRGGGMGLQLMFPHLHPVVNLWLKYRLSLRGGSAEKDEITVWGTGGLDKEARTCAVSGEHRGMRPTFGATRAASALPPSQLNRRAKRKCCLWPWSVV